MMRDARSWFSLIVVMIAPLSCAKSSHVPSEAKTQTPVAGAAAPAAEEPAPVKKSRFGNAAVYVDGLAVGVVRAQELPPSLRPISFKGAEDNKVYTLKDYVTALGVDVTKIRGVHLYGGKRVGMLSGDEFRRMGGRIRFAFSGNDHGKPGLLWPREHVEISTFVGTLASMTIYVAKEPPTYNNDGLLAYADGTAVTGVPYAPAEQSKGTRVYVDGKLVGVVKRRTLPANIALGTDLAHPKYSVAGYLSSIGVNPESAKAIDFISNDDAFLRVPAGKTNTLAFSIPAHSQGQIGMPHPTASDAVIKVSAVQLFIKSAPPSRAITVPEPGSDTGGGSGSGGGKQEDSALE